MTVAISLPFELAGMIEGLGSRLPVAELIRQLTCGLVILERWIERDQTLVGSQRVAALAGLHKTLGGFLVEFLRFFLIVLFDELSIAKTLTDGRFADAAELLIRDYRFGLVSDSRQIVEEV